MEIMRLIRHSLVVVFFPTIVLASPERTESPRNINPKPACFIVLTRTSLVEVICPINNECFMLEIKMKEPVANDKIRCGNVIQSVLISRGAEEYFLPKAFIPGGVSEASPLFSLGENCIGFEMGAGGGENLVEILFRIDTTNWHFVREERYLLSQKFLGATEGFLERVGNNKTQGTKGENQGKKQ